MRFDIDLVHRGKSGFYSLPNTFNHVNFIRNGTGLNRFNMWGTCIRADPVSVFHSYRLLSTCKSPIYRKSMAH